MNENQQSAVVLGLIVVAAVLHLTFVNWTTDYRVHERSESVRIPGERHRRDTKYTYDDARIIGFNRSIGILSQSEKTKTKDILYGLVGPVVVVTVAAFVHYSRLPQDSED